MVHITYTTYNSTSNHSLSEGSQLLVEWIVGTFHPLFPQRLFQLAEPHIRVFLLQLRQPHLDTISLGTNSNTNMQNAYFEQISKPTNSTFLRNVYWHPCTEHPFSLYLYNYEKGKTLSDGDREVKQTTFVTALAPVLVTTPTPKFRMFYQ